MNLEWTDHYPDADVLRSEIRAMVQSMASAVRDIFGDDHVRAVWFKGSGQKHWDSPLDYVPTLSDVDIHVWLSEAAAADFHDLNRALSVQAGMEAHFAKRVTRPIHTPRPQLNLINDLITLEDYVDSPVAIVETVYGEAPQPGDYADVAGIRSQDRAALVSNAAEVANVSRRLIDRPGPYLWDLLRSLSWRVSPIGSRVLSVSGMAPEEAWSMNRTRIAAALHERGLEQIAEPWQQFYLSGWELFLNPDDGDAGRDAIRAAIDALQLSGEFAQVR